MIIIALGIDATGEKHILSFRHGSTENGTLCREMLAASSYDTALRLLQNQVRVLAKDHTGAAESLREGLHETLAVKKLGIQGVLNEV